MNETPVRRLIETQAIIVAYAMSRLDRSLLRHFGFSSWRIAFNKAGKLLGVPPASMKNLRDEFDPVHGLRKGWHKRPLRPNRQRVLSEFCEVSDEALFEIVKRLLHGDRDTSDEIVRPIAFARERIENVAERLRTGRIAERYFQDHSEDLCGVPSEKLVDRRDDAVGFDFSVRGRPTLAIEVKGLKQVAGAVLFTDREWVVARTKAESYWLVVIGGLAAKPIGRLWANPAAHFSPMAVFRRSAAISWQATLSVA